MPITRRNSSYRLKFVKFEIRCFYRSSFNPCIIRMKIGVRNRLNLAFCRCLFKLEYMLSVLFLVNTNLFCYLTLIPMEGVGVTLCVVEVCIVMLRLVHWYGQLVQGEIPNCIIAVYDW